MSDTKKPIRLADIGQLEEELRQDLAEEEAKGKAADILYCESISDTLSDLSNLPTIDPESLRGHAKWVKDKELKFIIVDGENDSHEEPAICCTNCKAKISQSDFDGWVWNFCPVCGFIMEDATEEKKDD